jgi:hypothetical protein
MYRDVAIERVRVVNTLTSLCLRTLLLFNGGAIVALFTVLGHGAATVVAPGKLTGAFTGFASGTLFAMLAAGMAFFTQNLFWAFEAAQAEFVYQVIGADLAGTAQPAPPTIPKFATNVLWQLAVAFSWASLFAFGVGSWLAIQALKPAGH